VQSAGALQPTQAGVTLSPLQTAPPFSSHAWPSGAGVTMGVPPLQVPTAQSPGAGTSSVSIWVLG
jgi:hypothetical protein